MHGDAPARGVQAARDAGADAGARAGDQHDAFAQVEKLGDFRCDHDGPVTVWSKFRPVEPEVRALIERYGLRPLPVEGTLFAETYRSSASTAIVALYAADPPSRSLFHVLTHDEVWHVYAGDPFRLILLLPGGSSEDVVMGGGGHVQFTVPAGTWQAGELLPGSRFALFGCTMAPGFTPECFRGGRAAELIAGWPARAEDIRRLAVPDQANVRL